jgi:predicted RND superfamily exporter protein
MGVVMLGGILFSAILTFFVVPSAFYLFERVRAAKAEEGAGAGREQEAVAIAAGES